MSNFFNLNLRDVARGLIVAVFAGIALPVLAVFQTPGFDFATANWSGILTLAINGGIAGLAGYLSKNLLSSQDGKAFGKI